MLHGLDAFDIWIVQLQSCLLVDLLGQIPWMLVSNDVMRSCFEVVGKGRDAVVLVLRFGHTPRLLSNQRGVSFYYGAQLGRSLLGKGLQSFLLRQRIIILRLHFSFLVVGLQWIIHIFGRIVLPQRLVSADSLGLVCPQQLLGLNFFYALTLNIHVITDILALILHWNSIPIMLIISLEVGRDPVRADADVGQRHRIVKVVKSVWSLFLVVHSLIILWSFLGVDAFMHVRFLRIFSVFICIFFFHAVIPI